MIVYTVSFTENGDALNKKIAVLFDDVHMYLSGDVRGNLNQFAQAAFTQADAVIFIGAMGIAVRAAVPYIRSKDKDFALVVCDELGRFAIPVLSGHIGGANALANKIADCIGANVVITTATDINNVWAVDNWAVSQNLKINNICNIKHISSAMLRGDRVGLITDVVLEADFPPNVVLNAKDTECGICISPFIKTPYRYTLNLIPKCLCVGVGSKKNADDNALCSLLKSILNKYNIDEYAIKGVSTIDIKKDEASVLKLCKRLSVPLNCYSSEELNSVSGEFNSSEFVRKITGCDNVCERSAIMSAGGKIIVHKTAENGVTMAIAFNGGKER